ncbi:MAG: hypothetical protein FJY97_05485 [candidate division Zixibacteria bacterium]|nr:hypothetical protein [candidate division Zixibacteria bacterium]
MNQPRQDFRFDKSAYERPTQKWVCGWAAQGHACRIGPDQKGGCQATSACTPIRNGDRWACTRTAGEGGPCDDGPLPNGGCCIPLPKCQPVRSIRAIRTIVSWLVSAFTLGLLLIFLGESSLDIPRHRFVSPAPLAAPHDAITDCASCHVAARPQPISALLAGDTSIGDSRQCLTCHTAVDGLMPHGLGARVLASVTDHLRQTPVSSVPPAPVTSMSFVHANTQGEVACMSCHQEHRGKNARLTRMDVARCQPCHVLQFASFAEGHPEFETRHLDSSIRQPFNHVTHEKEYFATKGVSFACANCHQTAINGRDMQVAGFEKSCGGCHRAQTMRGDGIAVFRLPGVDFDTLIDNDVEIGAWPGDANLDLEEDMTPFMLLLLSADGKIAQDVKLLTQKDVHLYDLEGASEREIAAAGRIVWAVKELIFDLTVNGQTALSTRLNRVMRTSLEHNELFALTGQGSSDPEWLLPVMEPQWLTRLQKAQQIWLPELAAEIPLYRKGQPAKFKEIRIKFKDQGEYERENPRGGWYSIDKSFAIFYRPAGHADPFVRTWIDKTGNMPGVEAAEIFDALTATTAETPGQCMKCHRVDDTPDQPGRLAIWSESEPTRSVQNVTNFAHASHTSLKDCGGCHVFDAMGDFKSMTKATCAECHNSSKVGDTCLTCHQYHMGPFKLAPSPVSAASILR